jgi:hypothetical protein
MLSVVDVVQCNPGSDTNYGKSRKSIVAVVQMIWIYNKQEMVIVIIQVLLLVLKWLWYELCERGLITETINERGDLNSVN